MIIFALTRAGYEENLGLVESQGLHLWLSSGVVDELELEKLHQSGVSVSTFNYEIEREDQKGIESAMQTIKEHHPGQEICIV